MLATSEIPTILIVDDNHLNLDLLCRILLKAQFKVITATRGIDAIEQTNQQHPDLILLDVMMPDIDGFEVCKLLRQNPDTKDIPVIFVTASLDTEQKVKAFKLGANDYITKPFQKTELLARVKSQLQVFDLRKTLAKQNYLLQKEIDLKYEGEVLLLDINERLARTNQSLKQEIEHRKAVELELQAEIKERKQAEQKVRQSLKEKNLLLKEIHHRVKNNLLIVSSLLESQADYIDDPQAIKMLEDSQNRITSMALIHELLHCSTSLFEIDIQQYVTALVEHITNSYLTKQIDFHLNLQPIKLNIETAHPCGLIINELISNALEHAFVDRQQGNITIQFNRDKFGCYSLFLKDDGVGFPIDKNFYQSESLGLELVSTLVEQLEGKIEMENNHGTQIKITFKELDYENRF